MNRKPILSKVLERILKTLPLLSDRDLERIVGACNGLMRIRVQAKRDALKPVNTKQFVELPVQSVGQAQAPVSLGIDKASAPDYSARVTMRREDDGAISVVDTEVYKGGSDAESH